MKREAKPKTTKRSKKKNKVEKSRSPWYTVKNILAWTDHNAKKKRNEWLCEKMLEWVQKEDSLSIVAFCSSIGLPYNRYTDEVSKDPKLKEINYYVRQVIGERREKLAIYKDQGANPSVVLHTLREYHPIYREIYNEEKEHQKEISKADGLADWLEKQNAELGVPKLDEKNRKPSTKDK